MLLERNAFDLIAFFFKCMYIQYFYYIYFRIISFCSVYSQRLDGSSHSCFFKILLIVIVAAEGGQKNGRNLNVGIFSS